MAKYLDDSGIAGPATDETVKVSAVQARQGRLGRPVLIVLVASLLLVALAWGAAELWGVSIAPADQKPTDPGVTSTTTTVPVAAEPASEPAATSNEPVIKNP